MRCDALAEAVIATRMSGGDVDDDRNKDQKRKQAGRQAGRTNEDGNLIRYPTLVMP